MTAQPAAQLTSLVWQAINDRTATLGADDNTRTAHISLEHRPSQHSKHLGAGGATTPMTQLVCVQSCTSTVAMLYTPSRKHTTSWPRPRRTHHTTHHTTPHQKHIQQNTPTNTRHTTPHHTTPTTTRNRTSNTYHTPHRTHYATQHHTHISAATMSEQPCDTTPHPPSTRRKQCITCVLWNSSDSACTDRWHTMRIENKTVYTNATQRSHHDRRT